MHEQLKVVMRYFIYYMRKIFRKTNISYLCVSGDKKIRNVSFLKNFAHVPYSTFVKNYNSDIPLP